MESGKTTESIETPTDIDLSDEGSSIALLEERIDRLVELAKMRWHAHTDIHNLMEKMDHEFKATVDAKLEMLNQVRSQSLADRSNYLPSNFRDYYNEQHQLLLERISQLEKLGVMRPEQERMEAAERERIDAVKETLDAKIESARRLLYMMLGGLIVIEVLLKLIKF